MNNNISNCNTFLIICEFMIIKYRLAIKYLRNKIFIVIYIIILCQIVIILNSIH